MNRPLDYLALAVAGGLGTLLRAGCTTLAMRLAGGSPWAGPLATLAVNVVGSFLFGVLYSLSLSRLGLGPAWQAIVLVGLLGGFTTYSSFSFQAVEMLCHGRTAAALAYITATNLLALAAAWAGLRAGAGG